MPPRESEYYSGSSEALRFRRFYDLEITNPLKPKTIEFCRQVETVFGYCPYPWQAHAMQTLLEGHDVIIRAGTASGKSLCYQAMALAHPKAIVLVISPLVMLMREQVCCPVIKSTDI